MNFKVEKIMTRQDYAYAVYIRTLVFVQEQNCLAKNDFDSLEDDAAHFLCWIDDEPAGTARCRLLDDKTAKIERIAVLENYRGQGIGKALVTYIEGDLKKLPHITSVVMSAQDHALMFYQKLGYQVIGEGYWEEGIPHHRIELKLK